MSRSRKPAAARAWQLRWQEKYARRWVIRGGLYYPRDLRVVADTSGGEKT